MIAAIRFKLLVPDRIAPLGCSVPHCREHECTNPVTRISRQRQRCDSCWESPDRYENKLNGFDAYLHLPTGKFVVITEGHKCSKNELDRIAQYVKQPLDYIIQIAIEDGVYDRCNKV